MGQRKFLAGSIILRVRDCEALFDVLSFMNEIIGKLFNNKISAALLQADPISEDLQIENLWCILLFTDA